MRRLANMKSRRASRVTFHVRTRVKKQGRWYVASCVNLPVSTHGTTEADAQANLVVAIQLFVEACLIRGTLRRFIASRGWNPSLRPYPHLPAGIVALPVPLPGSVRRLLEERRA